MASGPRCGCRSRPPGGNQPERLPGFLPFDLSVRFVSFRFSPVRYLRFRFQVLTASRGHLPSGSYRFHKAERLRPAGLDHAVPSGWHPGEQPVVPTPADGEAGVSDVENLSSDFYDHLALCAPLFDVGQSFRSRLEWKDPVYNGTNSTGIDERAELA
jgi:hypothetical protein